MQDLLLLDDTRLEGPKQATLTVRPPRVAYLIHPADIQCALAAIGSACLSWGGVHHFLIPCEANGEPQHPWARGPRVACLSAPVGQ